MLIRVIRVGAFFRDVGVSLQRWAAFSSEENARSVLDVLCALRAEPAVAGHAATSMTLSVERHGSGSPRVASLLRATVCRATAPAFVERMARTW